MNDGVSIAVSKWIENAVIGLNLCPFAKREWVANKVRIKVSESSCSSELIEDLINEMSVLDENEAIETTLLVHPNVLDDFLDYNDFLGVADQIITELGYSSVYQLASFHPNYQFAGTSSVDVENYTNRAPYPILHLLREESLEKAIQSHPNTHRIPDDNIRRMNELGLEHMIQLLKECHERPISRGTV